MLSDRAGGWSSSDISSIDGSTAAAVASHWHYNAAQSKGNNNALFTYNIDFDHCRVSVVATVLVFMSSLIMELIQNV